MGSKTRLIFMTAVMLFQANISLADYRYSDSHLHIVDFFQEGESLKSLISQMDKDKVEHAMIAGIPLMKKWHENEPKKPRYYSGDNGALYWYSATDNYVMQAYQALPKDSQKRLHPFIAGFNPTDKNASAQLEKLIETYPGVWQGIGEVLTRHDDLTTLTQDEPPRANSEAMQKIYKLAAKYNLPVLLHSNITSKREKNPLYLGELEEALKSNPEVRFIWAHAGTSKTLHRYQGKMDFLLPSIKKLLSEHDNVFIDLSWTVLTPYLLNKQGKPNADWVALVEQYPTRFLIGSDLLGKFDNLGKNLQDFSTFLDALPKDVAQGLAGQNFLDLLPTPAKPQ